MIDDKMKSSSTTQTLAASALQSNTMTKMGYFSHFHWTHAVMAVGILAASGAGTALLFKVYLVKSFHLSCHLLPHFQNRACILSLANWGFDLMDLQTVEIFEGPLIEYCRPKVPFLCVIFYLISEPLMIFLNFLSNKYNNPSKLKIHANLKVLPFGHECSFLFISF